MMRRLLAIGGAVALGLSAMAASADELTGTISNIDLNRNTFMLEGKTFTASPTNTIGVKLSELAEGDKVTIEAEELQTGTQPINVMSLKKAE
jgi:ABC-type glycerol-3-phosphate transport system substrate-binding protein